MYNSAVLSQLPLLEKSQSSVIGLQLVRSVTMVMTVMSKKITMSVLKNSFHLRLVVMRISIIEIEIFAKASAQGVMNIAAQNILKTWSNCSLLNVIICLPSPW